MKQKIARAWKSLKKLLKQGLRPRAKRWTGPTANPSLFEQTVEPVQKEPVAWAWKCDGMKGWALGHVKPTPENTYQFFDRNTVVRPLVFGDEPELVVFSNPGKGRDRIKERFCGHSDWQQRWVDPESLTDPEAK